MSEATSPSSAPAPALSPDLSGLKNRFQSLLGDLAVFDLQGKLPAFRVPADHLHVCAEKMRAAGFDYLLLVTAVDYPAENRFEMVYVLTNFADAAEVALITDVNRSEPRVATVSDLWETADWHEREVYDLFGVKFDGHRDLRRILLDNTWEGHPLRKDYVDTAHQMIKRPY